MCNWNGHLASTASSWSFLIGTFILLDGRPALFWPILSFVFFFPWVFFKAMDLRWEPLKYTSHRCLSASSLWSFWFWLPVWFLKQIFEVLGVRSGSQQISSVSVQVGYFEVQLYLRAELHILIGAVETFVETNICRKSATIAVTLFPVGLWAHQRRWVIMRAKEERTEVD